MKRLTIAKAMVCGKPIYITSCYTLENEFAISMLNANKDNNVTIDQFCGITILNNSPEFQADLEKIVAKMINGENLRYFTGDYDKYYLTNYPKIKQLYDLMEAKAQGVSYGSQV